MSDLRELYQEVILDHNKSPCNFRKLEAANRMADGYNPLCGDHVTVYLHMEGDVIQDISFQGAGCAISKASASVMTSALKGKNKAEAQALFDKFQRMVTGEVRSPHPTLSPRGGGRGQGEGAVDPLELDEFAVFAGVREFPVRVKCASLAWHTLRAALAEGDKTVSTE
jgi:nitrogen fixation NifU-like protein